MSWLEEHVQPDVLLKFVDEDGRQWTAAAYVGELHRYDGIAMAERMTIHDERSKGMRLTGLTVVQR